MQQARDLMDKLGGSQTAQTAMSAYNTAGQLYRTAQAVGGQAVPATQVPFQQITPPASFGPTATNAAAIGFNSGGFPTSGQ